VIVTIVAVISILRVESLVAAVFDPGPRQFLTMRKNRPNAGRTRIQSSTPEEAPRVFTQEILFRRVVGNGTIDVLGQVGERQRRAIRASRSRPSHDPAHRQL
jgi:hypothetical protein